MSQSRVSSGERGRGAEKRTTEFADFGAAEDVLVAESVEGGWRKRRKLNFASLKEERKETHNRDLDRGREGGGRIVCIGGKSAEIDEGSRGEEDARESQSLRIRPAEERVKRDVSGEVVRNRVAPLASFEPAKNA
jgi:hypothetical protein